MSSDVWIEQTAGCDIGVTVRAGGTLEITLYKDRPLVDEVTTIIDDVNELSKLADVLQRCIDVKRLLAIERE